LPCQHSFTHLRFKHPQNRSLDESLGGRRAGVDVAGASKASGTAATEHEGQSAVHPKDSSEHGTRTDPSSVWSVHRACALYVGRLTPRLVSLGVRVIPSLLHTTHTQTHTLDTYIDRMGIFENFRPIRQAFIMPSCRREKSYGLSQVKIDPHMRMSILLASV
jgi:hypothetical protein